MSKTLEGVDVSKWQGQIDFAKLKTAVDFVVIRSSYGAAGPDEYFKYNQAQARAHDIPRMYYHYSYPDRGHTPQQEANHFINTVGSLQAGEGLVLDFEQPYGDPVGWSLQFLKHVQSLTGVKPLIYLNEATTNGYNWQPLVDADFGLWIASWGINDGSIPERKPKVGPWPFWALWQFTSRGRKPGIAGFVDVNVFNGDVEAFRKYGAKNGDKPASKPKKKPAAPIQSKLPKPSGRIYTVQKGDTLTSIASQHGMDWRALWVLNRAEIGNDPNKIFPGQQLRLSRGANKHLFYTVRKGDSLTSIADKFNVTWQQLHRWNHASIGNDPNRIYPGQRLRVS